MKLKEMGKDQRRLAAAHRLLRINSNNFPEPLHSDWYADLGRGLTHYKRIHVSLLDHFGRNGMDRLKVTHFGAGNGLYMYFLRTAHNVQTIAVEIDPCNVAKCIEAGINPNFKVQNAERTDIPAGSQNVVISDHFIHSGYGRIKSIRAFEEAHRILKTGGLLVMERALSLQSLEFKQFEMVRKFLPESGDESASFWMYCYVLRKLS